MSAIVHRPEHVSIWITESEREVRFLLRVAPEELFRVIGKNGRIASAIRMLLVELRRGDLRRFKLEIRPHGENEASD